jgi:hypothetical protein
MKTALSVLLASLALTTFTGCGRPFDVKTAPGFVELEDQQPYDYRAVAPEGVVVGIRAIKIEDKGDLSFWTRAVTLRMRQLNGYSLLTDAEATSNDGVKGKELTFGHDEQGKPYMYRVRLFIREGAFMKPRRLLVVEAGGTKELMDRYKSNVDWILSSLKVD